MTAAGKRTSVYADDLAATVAESGRPLAELIRRWAGDGWDDILSGSRSAGRANVP